MHPASPSGPMTPLTTSPLGARPPASKRQIRQHDRVGSSGGMRSTRQSRARAPHWSRRAILELHPVQAVEQALGILLIASLARIVGAQGHAAHAGKLLGRNLGILLVIKLFPEILVEAAAVHLGLGHDRGGHWAGKRGKRNGSDGKALHDSFSLSSGA